MTGATPSAPARSSSRRRVLITGAGGFLGGRATELLRERYGWDVVPLVREPKSAARLARWGSDIAIGDVCSATDMDAAMKGCDAVVHCAVGTIWPPEASRRVTVEGTRIAAEAARRAGVRRFVHISTLFVHRRDGQGILDESAPLEPSASDDYGQAKLAAEQALADVAKQGLSTVVLRPVRIYGPFSKTFTIRPLQALGEDRFAISGDPDVPANMVYVDNVVEAIARAIEAGDAASGAAFLVSDAEQVSLREFFGQFAALGGRSVKLVPAASSINGATPPPAGFVGQWMGGMRSILTSPELRAMVRKVISTDPIGTLPRKWWEASESRQQKLLKRFGADAAVIYRPSSEDAAGDLVYYGEPARVSIDKAQRELGFVPPVSRERAMALTAAWARYARLLP